MGDIEPSQSCPGCGGAARVEHLRRAPFDPRPECQIFAVECPACRDGAYLLDWDAYRAARGSKEVARLLRERIRADKEGRLGSTANPITLDDLRAFGEAA
ncbi:MAG: hypothetical protein ACYTKD_28110 [Planctomycetota bacterium]|jgi:hypothetical protein